MESISHLCFLLQSVRHMREFAANLNLNQSSIYSGYMNMMKIWWVLLRFTHSLSTLKI